MAMLKSLRGHERVGVRIAEYLRTKNGRCDDRTLAWDFVNMPFQRSENGWEKAMEETCRIFGNDREIAGKKTVYYHHFIISPDPRDHVDLDTLRALACDWAKEIFGDEEGGREGRCGIAEVAICYHDDNANGIPHAHLIVNNTNIVDGNRLRISNRLNKEVLPDTLQSLAAELGLSFFDNSRRLPRFGAYLTKVERAFAREGRFSWKQDMRDKVQIAMRTTRDEESFSRRLEELGVRVCPSATREGDWTYAHAANPERWAATGYRLGANYRRSAVAARLAETDAALRGDPERAENMSRRGERVVEALSGALRHMDGSLGEELGVAIAAYVAADVTVAQAAAALRINDKYGVESERDYETLIARAKEHIGSPATAPEARARLELRVRELELAGAVAARGEFFAGSVVPSSPNPGAVRRRSAERARRQAARSARGSRGGDAARRRPQAPDAGSGSRERRR